MAGTEGTGSGRHAGEEAGTSGRRKVHLASLKFDSIIPSAARRRGTRDAPSLEPRLLLVYATEVSDVVIDLDGQVFARTGEEHDRFTIRLLQNEAEHDASASDDLGGFAFETVPAGVYELLLTTDRFEVLISPLDLRVA